MSRFSLLTNVIRLAQRSEIQAVRAFFSHYLTSDNDAVANPEFLCPDGIQAAVLRKQMMLACSEDGEILAAARFYRKRSGEVSLYQFAVAPDARGAKLSRRLFDAIRAGSPMAAMCPTSSAFNAYYQKTGWKGQPVDALFTRWILD
jgi:hypothetical protein